MTDEAQAAARPLLGPINALSAFAIGDCPRGERARPW